MIAKYFDYAGEFSIQINDQEGFESQSVHPGSCFSGARGFLNGNGIHGHDVAGLLLCQVRMQLQCPTEIAIGYQANWRVRFVDYDN